MYGYIKGFFRIYVMNPCTDDGRYAQYNSFNFNCHSGNPVNIIRHDENVLTG